MASNTDAADVNEIYVAFALNNNSFPDTQSEAQYNRKLALLTADEGAQQIGRAIVMADEFKKWATRHGYTGIQNVYWTARPGFSFRTVVGQDVDQRKNPTDVLVEFRTGGFLGLSAKSTRGSTDIGFKNPGLGTVEDDLNIKLADINTNKVNYIVETFKLPKSAASRKTAIRQNRAIQPQTDAMGLEVLKEMRDILFNKLNTLSTNEAKAYLLRGWIDASVELFPPYVKVTGMGQAAPFTASVEDPLNNPKLAAIQNNKLTFEKIGDTSVGVKAGTKKICKMRFKYESEKLASSVKLSGDPWT